MWRFSLSSGWATTQISNCQAQPKLQCNWAEISSNSDRPANHPSMKVYSKPNMALRGKFSLLAQCGVCLKTIPLVLLPSQPHASLTDQLWLFFSDQLVFTNISVGPKSNFIEIFLTNIFLTLIFLGQKYFGTQFFLYFTFLGEIFWLLQVLGQVSLNQSYLSTFFTTFL